MSVLLRKPALPVVLLLCWLANSTVANAADARVIDNAKMFSSEAVSKANETLKEMQSKTGKSMIIETQRGIPANLRPAFQANRDKFYFDWAKARHDALKLDGTLFLVVEETRDDVAPGATPRKRIEYYTDKETSKLFTKAEADQTRERLGKMLNTDINQGLIDMVAFAKTSFVNQFAGKSPLANATEKAVLKQNKQAPPANHRADGNKAEAQGESKMEVGTIVLYIIGGLLAFWILIGLVRAFTRPRVDPAAYGAPPPPPGMGGGMNRGGMVPPPPPGYGQPYGGQPMGYAPQQQAGGMGFMGSLMTGMLGAAAGNFMYDRFFRGGSHGGDYGGSSASTGGGYFGGGSSSSQPADTGAAYGGGGDYDQADNSAATGGADYDQGMTGGSGDFGNNDTGYAGGGDYGSSSGGDFSSGGGGDFGGGGGDFGGGGGDFGGGGGDFSGGDSGGGGDY